MNQNLLNAFDALRNNMNDLHEASAMSRAKANITEPNTEADNDFADDVWAAAANVKMAKERII